MSEGEKNINTAFEKSNNIFNTSLKLEEVESLEASQEGRNSTVFIGKDIQLDAKYLIKRISKKELLKNSDDLFEESKILNLANHRNIMPIKYATEDEENIYMALPYMKKGSMNQMRNKYSSNRKLLAYCYDFLSGLAHAHVLDVLHADIKPSNIIIDDSDRAVLTDFGQSVKLFGNESVEPKPIYRPNASPSIIANEDIGVKDDIYQVGITLYRLFNSIYYIESLNSLDSVEDLKEKILRREFPKNKFMPHVPGKIKKIINKCLGRSAEYYTTVLDVMNDLCSINDMLDIGFEYSEDTKTYIWHQYTSTAIIDIELDLATCVLNGSKLSIESQNRTRVRKLCKECSTIDEALKMVADYLKG